MNNDVNKQLIKFCQHIADRQHLLHLFPHYEFDHVLVDIYNPELFTLNKKEIHFQVMQFKIGMN